MNPRLCALVALALAFSAGLCQGQVVLEDHVTGALLSSPLLLPDVPVNDFEQQAIDVVNQGTQSVTVGADATGLYYSLCCESTFVLDPGAKHTLTLKFAPTATGYMTGALHVDGATPLFVFGNSIAAVSLYLQTGSGSTQVFQGMPAEVTVNAGQSVTATLLNHANGPVIINAISSTGDWSIQGLPGLPLTLQAGQQASFTLKPSDTSATSTGTIIIDRWTYSIGAHAPSANVQIQTASTLVQSNQQVTVSVNFDQPPTSATGGTLTLTLISSGSGVSLTDPAVLFPSSGSNTVAFTSVPGQTAASFNGANSIVFQTGTTAGTLQLDAKWGFSENRISLQVEQAVIGIDSLTAQRSSNSVTITATAFDNTRTAGRMSFSFFDQSGAFIGNPVSSDFTEAFQTYFQSTSNAGGSFKMVLQFPVSGKTSAINSVRLDLSNQAGDAQSSVTRLQ